MDAESQPLEAFIVPNRRDRRMTALDNVQLRRKLRDRLCHHDDWQPDRAAKAKHPGRRDVELAALLAQRRGCH